MIKYLGSKRRLVDPIVAMAGAVRLEDREASRRAAGDARLRALDLFSGTARVGRALKRADFHVTAVDSATYAHVLASAYVAADADAVDRPALALALEQLNALPGRPGYVTEVFCENARFFHPDNGRRIDAIRDAIERQWSESPLYPLLLTSLLEAADRVDSTTGLQMAYLKDWAPRALRPLELRLPLLEPGSGVAVRDDAEHFVRTLPAPAPGPAPAPSPGTGPAAGTDPAPAPWPGSPSHFDVAYLDPPYNQHRYFTNYHVWETLVRWDAPEHYGIACKRLDCRDDSTVSRFNRRREMPLALGRVIGGIDCDLLLVSYNDESWVSASELVAMCETALAGRAPAGGTTVAVLGIDQPRYVGARIGIHNPAGEKVGEVSHLRNTEMIVAAGPTGVVEAAVRLGLQSAVAAGLDARLIDVATRTQEGGATPTPRRAGEAPSPAPV